MSLSRNDDSEQLFMREALLALGSQRPGLRDAALGVRDWHRVLDLAKAGSVTETIWAGVSLRDAEDAIPEPFRTDFREAHASATARNALMLAEAADLQAALRAAGIDSVILKGPGLLVAHYPDIGSRHMADIDLLVRARDAGRAEKVALGMGASQPPPVILYDGTEDHPEGGGRFHTLLFRTRLGAGLEIHTRVSGGAADGSDVEGVMSRARDVTWQGRTLRIPSRDDLAAIACRHVFEGHVGDLAYLPRHLADIAVSIGLDDAEWDALEAKASDRRSRAAIEASRRMLQVGIPSPFEAARSATVRRAKRWVERRVSTPEGKRRPSLFRILFPSRTFVAWCYGVRPDSPWIPLLYLWRPLRGAWALLTGAERDEAMPVRVLRPAVAHGPGMTGVGPALLSSPEQPAEDHGDQAAHLAKRFDLSIVGTVGVPARYGGFETLAESLVARLAKRYAMQVFCTTKGRSDRRSSYRGARLSYVGLAANGWQSIPYDMVSLFRAARTSRVILVLGVSGCTALPLVRLLNPRVRIVTNIDGLEWKRAKWGPMARLMLRVSEWFAVRFSHTVIADNMGIVEYLEEVYRLSPAAIAYGGDVSPILDVPVGASDTRFEDGSYFVTVCRIEPENQVDVVLKAFAQHGAARIVVVGNWNDSAYARELRTRYGGHPNMELLNPIYDETRIHRLRRGALGTIHGHSAGGTNPSLVEAMHEGLAVLAFDVNYNRHTTHDRAVYWKTADDLARLLGTLSSEDLAQNARNMRRLAWSRYTWRSVVAEYERALFGQREVV